jgi:hypothetical protein
MLLFFVEDGDRADWLGHGSRDAYLTALGLDPRTVDLALDGLKLSNPEKATSLNEAVILGRHGGDRGNQHTRGVRKLTNSSTDTAEYAAARLDRDHPAIAAEVRAGKISANATDLYYW